jgi:hypothetical protein
MTTYIYPYAAYEAKQNLDVDLDGEHLFEVPQRSRGDRITCRVVCGLTRGLSVVLLLAAAWFALQEDMLAAFNVGMFAIILLVSGLVGLRQFQNQPRRILLNAEGLHFYDPWNGEERHFPRGACLEARCGSECSCAVYVVHPDKEIDLLVDDLPHEVAEEIVGGLNRHLCDDCAAKMPVK